MESTDAAVESLREQVAACEIQLQTLKAQLAHAESRIPDASLLQIDHDDDMPDGFPNDFKSEIMAALDFEHPPSPSVSHSTQPTPQSRWPLRPAEYKRYGRQLIMPQVGLQGQMRLRQARVLIVGAGGLGCPAAAYLAGAGVGTLGLVDDDTVEESNLHRQILHTTVRVGMTKVDSATMYLQSLNPNVKLAPHRARLETQNALDIFQQYDLVLDCTDTPASRYLISDACVLLGKPLVSASALKTEGQLMVLNNPPLLPGDSHGGPCYRCIFPKPPPAESVTSCGEGGILGPVVGVMGVLQALEAIKLIVAGHSASQTSPVDLDGMSETKENNSMLLFSAYDAQPFRTIRLRSRKPTCAACSPTATVTKQSLLSGSMDYVQFCGATGSANILTADERISAKQFATSGISEFSDTPGFPNILVDTREPVQFDMCHLEGSINVPFSEISATAMTSPGQAPDWVTQLASVPLSQPITLICRLGNDSQVAVRKLKQLGLDNGGQRWIGDIQGGLKAWRETIDPDFPDY